MVAKSCTRVFNGALSISRFQPLWSRISQPSTVPELPELPEQGLVNLARLGDFEDHFKHHFQVSVGDYIAVYPQ